LFLLVELYDGIIYVLLEDKSVVLQLDPPAIWALRFQGWDASLASNLIERSQWLRPLPKLVIYSPAEFLIARIALIIGGTC
jgi:hypothetical protein